MIYPKFIKAGSLIGVPAPSAGADNQQRVNKMNKAKETLENLGYKLMLSNNLFTGLRGRSSDARKRAKEVNQMFERKDIDFILCAAGGEFLLETLPYIDFELIKYLIIEKL